ncbi:unnamed protein product [Soboliphyme baturini]|uniref:Emerin n=1 Tax=Soboliphyme baturini TaxID=241478 RepID=A0A183IFM0_9BILA|nr:unnamed protein product [Soboliphyme baturini]
MNISGSQLRLPRISLPNRDGGNRLARFANVNRGQVIGGDRVIKHAAYDESENEYSEVDTTSYSTYYYGSTATHTYQPLYVSSNETFGTNYRKPAVEQQLTAESERIAIITRYWPDIARCAILLILIATATALVMLYFSLN